MGEWSYRSSKVGTRIDHAVISPNLVIDNAAYQIEIDGLRCAGAEKHLYDHAPLAVEINVRLPDEPVEEGFLQPDLYTTPTNP